MILRVARFAAKMLPGKELEIVCRRYVKKRTDEQNSALWGVAYPPIMNHMGLSGEREREELHEYWLGEYFGWVEYKIMGQRKKRPRRTTTTDENGRKDKLTTAEFAKFYDFIQRRAATFGIFVPDPDPMFKRVPAESLHKETYTGYREAA